MARRRRSDSITSDPSIATTYIGIRAGEDTISQVDDLAARRGLKRSAIIREALDLYLAQQQEAQPA